MISMTNINSSFVSVIYPQENSKMKTLGVVTIYIPPTTLLFEHLYRYCYSVEKLFFWLWGSRYQVFLGCVETDVPGTRQSRSESRDGVWPPRW